MEDSKKYYDIISHRFITFDMYFSDITSKILHNNPRQYNVLVLDESSITFDEPVQVNIFDLLQKKGD